MFFISIDLRDTARGKVTGRWLILEPGEMARQLEPEYAFLPDRLPFKPRKRLP
jgi:hypothetical protein